MNQIARPMLIIVLAIAAVFAADFTSMVCQAAFVSTAPDQDQGQAQGQVQGQDQGQAPTLVNAFWEKDSSWREKMDRDGHLFVSATSKVNQDKTKNSSFRVDASGIVRVPIDDVWRLVRQYVRLKEASDFFKEVRWDANKNQMFVLIEAFGYRARLLMHVTESAPGQPHSLNWNVIDGPFKGLFGLFQYSEFARRKTQVTFSARYENLTLPFGHFPLSLMEVAAERVAKRLQTFLQDIYQREQREPAANKKSL
jgi:ribosome-associated toxin RatA of RatAB toxin-antitoxin module